MSATPQIAFHFPSENVPTWQSDLVAFAHQLESVDVVAFFLSDAPGTTALPRFFQIADNIEQRISQRLYGRAMQERGIHADTISKLQDLLLGAPLKTVRAGHLDDTDSQSAVGVDLIVSFDHEPPSKALLGIARRGVVFLDFSANCKGRAGQPGFWDYIDDCSVSISRLVHVDRLEGRKVLAERAYRTHRYSWNENRRRLTWKASWQIRDFLERLTADRAGIDQLGYSPPPQVDVEHVKAPPGWFATVGAICKLITRPLAASRYTFLFDPKWHVLIGDRSKATANYARLESGEERFWADPFPLAHAGRTYVFAEEFPYSLGRGVISCIELGKTNAWPRSIHCDQSQIIIEEPYHMSYPFLFRHSGQLYMVPESSANRTVTLWRCDDFPYKWSKLKNIFENISAVDTTIFEWSAQWWMFTNIDRTGTDDHFNELHVFYTSDPVNGTWIPHPQNPVVCDPQHTRMAGGVVPQNDGTLLRYAQAGGSRYGRAVAMRRITHLDRETYTEVDAGQLSPDWSTHVTRTHHFAERDGLIAIDANEDVFKGRRWLMAFKSPSRAARSVNRRLRHLLKAPWNANIAGPKK